MRLRVNDREEELAVEPEETLLEVLRDRLELTSVRESCGVGMCGACTAIVDGQIVSTCIFPAILAEGTSILTIEGLHTDDDNLHPIQKALLKTGGIQCGYCTPGFILTIHTLLIESSCPDEESVKDYLSGNLCRCTGYTRILATVNELAVEQSGTGGSTIDD